MSNNNRHHSQGSDQPTTAQSTRPSFSVDTTDNEPTPRPSRASLTAAERPSNDTGRSRSRPTAPSSPYDAIREDEHHHPQHPSQQQQRGDFPEIRAYYAK